MREPENVMFTGKFKKRFTSLSLSLSSKFAIRERMKIPHRRESREA